MTITAVSTASHGTVSLSANQVSYTLDDLSARSDSFTYTITDQYGGLSTATVNILVAFDNPQITIGIGQVAKSLTYTDTDGTAVTISVTKGTADLLFTGSGLTVLGTTKLTVDGSTELGQIVLSNTTTASSLKIATKAARTAWPRSAKSAAQAPSGASSPPA